MDGGCETIDTGEEELLKNRIEEVVAGGVRFCWLDVTKLVAYPSNVSFYIIGVIFRQGAGMNGVPDGFVECVLTGVDVIADEL